MLHGHEYSLYTGLPSSRRKTYALLAIFSATFVSIFHSWGFEFAKKFAVEGQDLTWFALILGSIAPLAVFGGIVVAFDQWIWKWRIGAIIFTFSGGKQPPSLAGEYEGNVAWFNPSLRPEEPKNGTFVVRVRIRQTWERIVVRFDFFDSAGHNRSGANSDMAVMHVGMDPREVVLHSTYSYGGAEPKPDGQGVTTWMIHGTSLMTFSSTNAGWHVAGTYYSDDGGSGTIRLTSCA